MKLKVLAYAQRSNKLGEGVFEAKVLRLLMQGLPRIDAPHRDVGAVYAAARFSGLTSKRSRALVKAWLARAIHEGSKSCRSLWTDIFSKVVDKHEKTYASLTTKKFYSIAVDVEFEKLLGAPMTVFRERRHNGSGWVSCENGRYLD